MKLIFFVFLALISIKGHTQRIDSEASVVNFRIGNMRVNTVNGTFTGMRGTVQFDPQNLSGSAFSVCIDPATVNTGINRRDRNLKEEAYFDVERFPSICYVSDIISTSEQGFVTRGKLTMKGITRNVTIPFIKEGNTFRGTLSLKRLDYNVGDGVSTFVVSNRVELEIICIIAPSP